MESSICYDNERMLYNDYQEPNFYNYEQFGFFLPQSQSYNINDSNELSDEEFRRLYFTDENSTKDKNIIIGRRKKNGKYNEIAKHDKFSFDNVMRKIKTSLLNFLVKILNSSLKSNIGRFRPLNKTMKESLNKRENMELLDAKIKDIFSKTKMNKVSEKNGEKKGKSKSNKELIDKIYEDNKEKQTINILDMTFEEFLIDTRDNNLEAFLQIIKQKESKIESNNKNKNFDIEKYMIEFTKLLFGYKKWFNDKTERAKRNKNIY